MHLYLLLTGDTPLRNEERLGTGNLASPESRTKYVKPLVVMDSFQSGHQLKLM
jgi:hypothetical protein